MPELVTPTKNASGISRIDRPSTKSRIQLGRPGAVLG